MRLAEGGGKNQKGDGRKSSTYLTGKDDNEHNSDQRYFPGSTGNLKPPCVFCHHVRHGIWNCRNFQLMSVRERWKIAKEKQLCF